MKRLIAIFLLLICILLCFSGCDSKSEKEKELETLQARSKALGVASDNLQNQINQLERAYATYKMAGGK